MNRILGVVVLVLVAVGVTGYYLGWFGVGSERTDGKDRVTFTVDEDKIKQDEKKAKEKLQDLGRQAKDSVAPTGKQ